MLIIIKKFLPIQVDEICRIHGANSEDHFRTGEQLHPVQLSIDGVSETSSTSISLDVYSVKFDACRDIYPIRIVRPLIKNELDQQEQFQSVLNELSANNLLLVTMVADNPKRAFCRNSVQHSGKFSCEYCFHSGVSFRLVCNEETVKVVDNIQRQRKELLSKIKSLRESKNTEEIQSLEGILKSLQEAEKIAKKKDCLVMSFGQQTHVMLNCEPGQK